MSFEEGLLHYFLYYYIAGEQEGDGRNAGKLGGFTRANGRVKGKCAVVDYMLPRCSTVFRVRYFSIRRKIVRKKKKNAESVTTYMTVYMRNWAPLS